MVKTVIKSFAGRREEKSEPGNDKVGRHKTANKKMRDALPTDPSMIQSKKNKQDQTKQQRANLITFYWDEGMQVLVDKKQPIYYIDLDGIDMIYPHGSKLAKLCNLDTIENHKDDNNFNVMMGCKQQNPSELTFIALKVSERQKKIPAQKMLIYDASLKGMLQYKPSIIRGTMRNGVTHHYVCHGQRKNPLDTDLGEYAFNEGVPEATQMELKKGVNQLVADIEYRALEEMRSADLRICAAYANYFKVQNMFDLPSLYVGGIATQFAIGKAYCSRVHSDDDFFLTTLSLYDAEAEPDEVLYNFCFPTYRIAIPMRSGDIIHFNPLVPHCATNPRRKTTMIYSAYVSNKTCNTAAANASEKSK